MIQRKTNVRTRKWVNRGRIHIKCLGCFGVVSTTLSTRKIQKLQNIKSEGFDFMLVSFLFVCFLVDEGVEATLKRLKNFVGI